MNAILILLIGVTLGVIVTFIERALTIKSLAVNIGIATGCALWTIFAITYIIPQF